MKTFLVFDACEAAAHPHKMGKSRQLKSVLSLFLCLCFALTFSVKSHAQDPAVVTDPVLDGIGLLTTAWTTAVSANSTVNLPSDFSNSVLSCTDEFFILDNENSTTVLGDDDYYTVRTLASAISNARLTTQYYGDLLASAIPSGYAAVPVFNGWYSLEITRISTTVASFTICDSTTGRQVQTSHNFADVAEVLSDDELTALPFSTGALDSSTGALTSAS